MKLKDKTAIITGGGSGIGKAIAIAMAKEGANIVITDLVEERLTATERDIKAYGRDVLALKSDVSVIADIKNMVNKTIERFSKIDILVNNAGVYTPGPFLEKDEAAFEQVVAINQKGVFFCTQLVAREMVKRKYGKIIGICSSTARIGVPMYSDYVGTKGAMLAMTRAMAAELSPLGINVNAIACGLTPETSTFRTTNFPQEDINFMINMTPMRRTGTVDDYTAIAILLASDEASFITGQTISVDGGVSMP
ncbi:MAG: glucose 1-dehydrogenase [Proteobacteria bacterium]|nr:glucose 1-dehydrogenase [Pseudomonadota bacterium]